MDITLKRLREAWENMDTLQKIQETIESAGGEIFVVGGPVRDKVLGKTPKDIDFLVRKLTLEQIAAAIRTIGKADEVGKAFGVVKGTVDGDVYDFAIPRTKEVKTGDSHTDFAVQTDPNASVEDDMKRRDFTWNSMAMSLRDFIAGDMHAVIDPNGGMQDLKNKVLRAVGDPAARFGEDPLRMLRAVQFATRMGFNIEGETLEAIQTLKGKLKSVSGERILEEFKKAWTKGNADSEVFIALLEKTGVGKLLFGADFDPQPVKLDFGMPLKASDDIVAARMVAFFLKGGNIAVMKPEAIQVKFLEVAKKTFFSEEPPFTFIGNMKPLLPILFAVAMELDESVAEKVRKMMDTPITAKELAVGGEEIASFLGVKPGKEIGMAQRMMLAALWEGSVKNNRDELLNLVATHMKK
jgi:tRNA nucleotidyltransferase/poly(A) polymerase